LNINILSDKLDIHRSRLSRMFKSQYGIPPSEYIHRLRFRRALLMLKESAAPVSQTAFKCGFSDPAYFSRVFCREMGITPTQFRKSL